MQNDLKSLLPMSCLHNCLLFHLRGIFWLAFLTRCIYNPSEIEENGQKALYKHSLERILGMREYMKDGQEIGHLQINGVKIVETNELCRIV